MDAPVWKYPSAQMQNVQSHSPQASLLKGVLFGPGLEISPPWLCWVYNDSPLVPGLPSLTRRLRPPLLCFLHFRVRIILPLALKSDYLSRGGCCHPRPPPTGFPNISSVLIPFSSKVARKSYRDPLSLSSPLSLPPHPTSLLSLHLALSLSLLSLHCVSNPFPEGGTCGILAKMSGYSSQVFLHNSFFYTPTLLHIMNPADHGKDGNSPTIGFFCLSRLLF